jgi:hypothetical protein
MVTRHRKAVPARGYVWHWVAAGVARCGTAPRGGWVDAETVAGVTMAPRPDGRLREVRGCGTCIMLAAMGAAKVGE